MIFWLLRIYCFSIQGLQNVNFKHVKHVFYVFFYVEYNGDIAFIIKDKLTTLGTKNRLFKCFLAVFGLYCFDVMFYDKIDNAIVFYVKKYIENMYRMF